MHGPPRRVPLGLSVCASSVIHSSVVGNLVDLVVACQEMRSLSALSPTERRDQRARLVRRALRAFRVGHANAELRFVAVRLAALHLLRARDVVARVARAKVPLVTQAADLAVGDPDLIRTHLARVGAGEWRFVPFVRNGGKESSSRRVLLLRPTRVREGSVTAQTRRRGVREAREGEGRA